MKNTTDWQFLVQQFDFNWLKYASVSFSYWQTDRWGWFASGVGFIFRIFPVGWPFISLKWSEVKWSEVAQSCPTLCNPMDCSPPGFSVHGIFQARVLQWVAISFSRGSSWPRDWTQVSCIAGRFFTTWATREAPLWRTGQLYLTIGKNRYCF